MQHRMSEELTPTTTTETTETTKELTEAYDIDHSNSTTATESIGGGDDEEERFSSPDRENDVLGRSEGDGADQSTERQSDSHSESTSATL